jgi:hypothetical protein
MQAKTAQSNNLETRYITSIEKDCRKIRLEPKSIMGKVNSIRQGLKN